MRWLAMAMILGAGAVDAAGIDDIAFLGGSCWDAPGHEGQTETHCYRFVHQGNFLEDQLTVSLDGRALYTGRSIYRATPEGAIRWIYYGDAGGWMEGVVTPVDGGFDIPPSDWVGPDGTRLTMRVRWTDITADAFVSETETLIDGAWQLTSRREFRRGAPTESPTGAFLFKSSRDGNDDLYLWRDGEVLRLTDNEVREHWPAPSATGLRMLWFQIDGDTRNLMFGELQDGRLVNVRPFLPSPGQDLLPAWSPTGVRVAFFSSRDEGGIGPEGLLGHVYVARPNGTEVQRVTTAPIESTTIAWRPDGEALAYRVAGRIRVHELASGDTVDLAIDGLDGLDLGHPAWSPDSQWIAFHAQGEGGSELYRAPAGGGPAVPVLVGAGYRYAPAWSPDGRWILYTGSTDGEDHDVRAILVTGGADQPVAASPADDRLGAWLPHGAR